MTAPFLMVVDLRLIEQQVNKILQAKLASNDKKIVSAVREPQLQS